MNLTAAGFYSDIISNNISTTYSPGKIQQRKDWISDQNMGYNITALTSIIIQGLQFDIFQWDYMLFIVLKRNSNHY